MKKTFLTVVFSAMVLTMAAQATPLSFDLTEDFCTGGCGSEPFGNIQLQQVNSNSVQVTLTLSPGNVFVKTGAGKALDFSINGAALTSVTDITTGFTFGSGGFSTGSVGSFTNFVECSGCGNGASKPLPGPLVFTVNRTGGLSVDDFVGNAKGFYFAADIYGGGTGNTGNVAALGSNVQVSSEAPEPGTFGILGAALVGLGILGKRRRK